jgi:thioredoxin reductase (NADPH)
VCLPLPRRPTLWRSEKSLSGRLHSAPEAGSASQLIRGDDLGKSMSRYLVDRIVDAENVELHANAEVRELTGEDRLEGVVVENNRSGARRTLGARALFIFIGAKANTGWLEWAVELDERGFVMTGRALDGSSLEEDAWQTLSRESYLLETSLPGVRSAQ